MKSTKIPSAWPPVRAAKLPAVALVSLAAIVIGCAPALEWRVPTPDHRGTVEVREHEDLTCVWVDSLLEGCYEAVALESMVFGADGRHLAYAVESPDGWRVIRDGQPGPAWSGVAALTFSPDGRHLAYAASSGSTWCVMLDGVRGECWDSLLGEVTFAPRGAGLAYVADRGGRVHAVRDGSAGPGHDAVTLLRFSPDGSRLAYVAWSGSRACLVVDGVEGPPVDRITDIVFSPDGQQVAYAARRDGQWFVFEDRSSFGPHDSVRDLSYANRGIAGAQESAPSLFYVARGSEGMAVFVDGVPGPFYDQIDTPVFADGGDRWGYIGLGSDGFSVLLDDRLIARESHASNLMIAPGGRAYAYIAKRGHDAFVVDEEGCAEFDVLVEGSLIFCDDGVTWACLAGDADRESLYVAVEDVPERREFDWEQIVRLTRQSESRGAGPADSSDLIRAWVAAEAELLLERQRSAGIRGRED